MSRKKGLSAEEKSKALVELYLEENTVFNLKELEKIAPKKKGIVQQSVKDVNQSLVDEGMVSQDKIGVGQFFWCFPSDAFNKRQTRVAKLTTAIAEAEASIKTSKQRITGMKRERGDGQEREDNLKRVKELQTTDQQQTADLEEISALDPDVLKKMKTDAKVAADAANRWTDSVTETVSYLKNKFGQDESMIRKRYAIPDELEFIQ